MNERLKDNVDLEEARHDAQSRSHFHNIPDSLNKKISGNDSTEKAAHKKKLQVVLNIFITS